MRERLIEIVGKHWLTNVTDEELKEFEFWSRGTQVLIYNDRDLGNAFRGYVVGLSKANFQKERNEDSGRSKE